MRSDPRRTPPAPRLIGRALAPLYRAAVQRRNAAFDRGERVVDVGPPVISVGNLSVGGTGKTPVAMWILDHLRSRDVTVALAMRGYRSRATGESDEAAEYRHRFPDLPLVAQPDRIAGLRALMRERREGGLPSIEAILLDDGFQHRFIARALDILLLDASRDPFEDRCLPAGWLREPVESIARADAVVLTHAELASAPALRRLRARIDELASSLPVCVAEHAWRNLETEAGPLDLEALRGARVVAACGVGHPRAVVEKIRRLGGDVVESIALRDHAVFNAREVQRLRRALERSGCETLLVTEKDWVKLARVADADLRSRTWRPALSIRLREGEQRLRELVDRAVEAAAPVSSGQS